MKNLTAVIAVLMLIFAALACSSDETDKANGLVDEANKFVTDANQNVKDSDSKYQEFNKMFADAEESKDGQQKLKDFVDKELIPLYDKMKDNFSKAGDKFADAGKLKVNDKYKEYLNLKSQEFKKRAEYAESLKSLKKSLADSKGKDDFKDAVKKDDENSQKILNDAKDLATKADKIQSDNPGIFKKN